jgi:hypothetical protein
MVTKYPIYSAMVQFAILGTLGDCMANWIYSARYGQGKATKAKPRHTIYQLVWKPIKWMILAIFIKVAFVGYTGFVGVIVESGWLPYSFGIERSFLNALAISTTMNLQFGLFLVIIHRTLDYLPFGKIVWIGIHKGFYSLLWFWIPAHTITFMLPKEYQIGLAAFYSVVLGFILGLFSTKKS